MEGERNMAAVRRLIEEGFGQGNLAVVDELVDPAVLEHQPGMDPANGEGVKRAIRVLHAAFPDFAVSVQHLTADGDLVWIHFTAQGTHLGPLLGPFGRKAPTGKPMRIDVMDLARCRDGRIVEHWGVPDRFTQMLQLGLLPQPQEATQV